MKLNTTQKVSTALAFNGQQPVLAFSNAFTSLSRFISLNRKDMPDYHTTFVCKKCGAKAKIKGGGTIGEASETSLCDNCAKGKGSGGGKR